jgi:hypothetical protein
MQRDIQKERHTGIHGQTFRLTDVQTFRLTDIQTYRRIDAKTNRLLDAQMCRRTQTCFIIFIDAFM